MEILYVLYYEKIFHQLVALKYPLILILTPLVAEIQKVRYQYPF